jgi:TolB protein
VPLESNRCRRAGARITPALLVAAALACRQADGPRPSVGIEAAPAAEIGSSAFDLVYERTVGGNQDVYLLPAHGAERALTRHAGIDGLPRWSRDGTQVFFSSDRSGNWQLYRVDPAGGEPARVRTNQTTDWQGDPSPEGSRLAFLSKQDGPEELFVMDLASGRARSLVRHGRRSVLGNPDWSPDGGRIVFSSNWKLGHHIYLLDVGSGKDRQLTTYRAGGCEPRFHPDGKRFVYVRRGFQSEKSRLVEHDLSTGRETTLVDWPAKNYNPVYSPDGSEVAFSSNITGDWVVYRQRLSDGRAWRVTHGTAPARYPDYRPRS